MRAKSSLSRPAFTLVELLVVIAIIGMLVGLLLPAVSAARGAGRKTQCANSLRQVGIGLLGYHAAQNQFPKGSTIVPRARYSGLSWHVFILPQIEHGNVFDIIAPMPNGMATSLEPSSLEIPSFLCASAPSTYSHLGAESDPLRPSHFAGVAGGGRLPDSTKDLEDDHCGDYFTDGILYPDSQVSTAHIKDGQSKTLMVGERQYFPQDWTYGAHWEKRPDVKVCMNSTKNVRWAINGDPEIFGYHVLDDEAPEGAKLLRVNDAMFDSLHPGGVNFIYADGHLEFITDDTDIECLRDLATISGASYQVDSGLSCE